MGPTCGEILKKIEELRGAFKDLIKEDKEVAASYFTGLVVLDTLETWITEEIDKDLKTLELAQSEAGCLKDTINEE